MDGDARREKILGLLENSEEPVSGKELASKMGVSRQVIVQDVALLRAVNKNILATNKGYMMYGVSTELKTAKKSFKVLHKTEEIQDELYCIVDLGGKVLDVVVEHKIYGQINVDFMVENRQDVDDFIDKMVKYNSKALKELTAGVHFHTVEAKDEETLMQIEEKLIEKGYLIK
ncbi:transcription repressor NadR [Anaerosacchariphilus polymeriproducens]|uniref:Transcription repressor NadR n=1 Tax=Anaerosacchariphilus polymeriproducens TaxID=1812858 RepID=A0A371AZU8_9FIRM|nr:transcription repressor NadR [Anaerosacchariphilus polymeriproducens]RDU25087.1 transcription repressor NadR [Anaerosacchariphilus polymeriproducens]